MKTFLDLTSLVYLVIAGMMLSSIVIILTETLTWQSIIVVILAGFACICFAAVWDELKRNRYER